MARNRWNDDRDRWSRLDEEYRERNGPGHPGGGYDPYEDDTPRQRSDHNRRPEFGSSYNAAGLGVPGALGTSGHHYSGGGAFGSRGMEDTGPDYPYERDYGYDRFYRGRGPERHDDHRGFWDRASDEAQSWMGDDDAERRRRMDRQNHNRGRGPRGYTRSDARINEDVHDRLTEDWILDASDIEVSVENGEVTLTGTIANRQDKRRAEDIVDSISGVAHVQNNLRVKPRDNDRGTAGSLV